MKNFKDFGIDVPYGRTAGQIKTHCPQCRNTRSDKRDKSLSVDLGSGVWNCHYCGFAGGLQEKRENKPYFNPRPLYRQRPEYKKPTPPKTDVIGDRAAAWFASRGIGADVLRTMRITEGKEWMPQKDGEVNTVQFNYYRDGELVNTKYRTGDKCFKMVSGAELILYNIDGIKGTKEAIITEGEMDALSFIAAGRTDVVSVPNGANANLSYLDDYLDEYLDDKEVIYIAVDTDTKGVLLRDELIRRLGSERCRIVQYGEECKDANEHLMKFGADSLMTCLANAPEVKIEGIFTVSDFEGQLDALFEHGLQRGFTTGHENFDNLCSFETRRLCIVSGIPGGGKSEFIDEIAERLNMRYSWRFAFFSPENAPLEYHASKLIEKFTGRKFRRSELSLGEYRQAKEHLEENFFFISPPDSFKLDNILEKAAHLVRKKGIRGLVIDPYNRLESEQGARSETQYISGVLDKLTNFAQIHDVLVVLMAHPTKQARSKEGIIEAPTLYDISGSANFFNKADYGIVVHRDRINDITQVYVQKVKFKHLGQCGMCEFKYNINNGRYTPFSAQSLDSTIAWDNSNHLTTKRHEMDEKAAANAVLNFEVEQGDDCPF